MKNEPKGPRPATLSLRLSPDERQRLEQDAQGEALSAYIKRRVFNEPAQRVRRPLIVRDQRTVAQLLACLGASGLAAHMQELADAARSGSLDCDADTISALRTACADISAIRSVLVAALGLKDKRPPRPTTSTPCRAFDSASAQDAGRPDQRQCARELDRQKSWREMIPIWRGACQGAQRCGDCSRAISAEGLEAGRSATVSPIAGKCR